MFDGRESSLEGDSSNDAEENMEEGDIEELLGWPLELLIMADEERRARKRRKTRKTKEQQGGRDGDVQGRNCVAERSSMSACGSDAANCSVGEGGTRRREGDCRVANGPLIVAGGPAIAAGGA
jgi:hypothetical protein